MRGDTRVRSVFQSFCHVFQGQEPIWLCMALLVVWGKGCIDAWSRLLYCGMGAIWEHGQLHRVGMEWGRAGIAFVLYFT